MNSIERFIKIMEHFNDPNWTLSLGENTSMIHQRNGHYHKLIDPNTGNATVHYDDIDPHESLESMLKHMWQSKKGKKVLQGIAAAAVTYAVGKYLK